MKICVVFSRLRVPRVRFLSPDFCASWPMSDSPRFFSKLGDSIPDRVAAKRACSAIRLRHNEAMPERPINASEIKSFAFCARAWFLEREGLPSDLETERARGVSDHRRHGIAAARADAAGRLSSALLILGLAGLAVAVFWWLSR